MVVPFSRIYAAFAAGYLMSYVFRTVNAMISPELTRELALQPGALGLLTSTYFMTFAIMQIPAGMLSFLLESRRVDNRRMLADLGLQLRYPTLQSGVLASFAEMRHTREAGTT